jgi:23S rRNA pseudouridine1911/1915/1917 synthase
VPDTPQGTITGHIGRNIRDRKIMQVFPDGSQGKQAITHYKVLESFGYTSVVECKLETGRTHQIRVHFSHIRHPLFNDDEYGGNEILKGTTFAKYQQFIRNCFKILPRQALHAKSLAFDHPVSGERLSFDSELPEDMKQVILKWRKYTGGRSD